MPYSIVGRCAECGAEDGFSIGLWPEHAGVCQCRECKALSNVALESGCCRKCGVSVAPDAFYDYARSIPYFRGMTPHELDRGPTCLRCNSCTITFENTAHFNVGVLGRTTDGSRPWIGQDTLEKAIFVMSLFRFVRHYDLDRAQLLAYYNLDVPRSLMQGRNPSFPIYRDIEAHIAAHVMSGEAHIRVSHKFGALLDERYEIFQARRRGKSEENSSLCPNCRASVLNIRPARRAIRLSQHLVPLHRRRQFGGPEGIQD